MKYPLRQGLRQLSLTPKERRFCIEYLKDLNATSAYLRAGYTAKNNNVAGVQGLRLLRKPKIAAEIARLQQEQQERTQITADKVLDELAAIAFSRVTDVCSFNQQQVALKDSSGLTDWQIASIQEVGQVEAKGTVRTYVKQHGREGALKLLAQHLGLTSDFNQALATLRKYGLILRRREGGGWEVVEIDEASTDS